MQWSRRPWKALQQNAALDAFRRTNAETTEHRAGDYNINKQMSLRAGGPRGQSTPGGGRWAGPRPANLGELPPPNVVGVRAPLRPHNLCFAISMGPHRFIRFHLRLRPSPEGTDSFYNTYLPASPVTLTSRYKSVRHRTGMKNFGANERICDAPRFALYALSLRVRFFKN